MEDNIVTRGIKFVEDGQTILVSTIQSKEVYDTYLQIRFTFEPNVLALEYVIADNESGEIRMITSRGIRFYSGPLFNQLSAWFNEIVPLWLQLRD
jgi:hypothetical protein